MIRRVYEEMPMPIMVTENGIATADDTRRVAYIQTAMKGVENCIQDGIPVKGYMYWSMMDNFEWQKGFGTVSYTHLGICLRACGRRHGAFCHRKSICRAARRRGHCILRDK